MILFQRKAKLKGLSQGCVSALTHNNNEQAKQRKKENH